MFGGVGRVGQNVFSEKIARVIFGRALRVKGLF